MSMQMLNMQDLDEEDTLLTNVEEEDDTLSVLDAPSIPQIPSGGQLWEPEWLLKGCNEMTYLKRRHDL